MYFFYEDKGTSLRAEYSNCLEAKPHIHDHLELVYVCEGSSKAALDFAHFDLQKGDIFLSFPNQVHEYYEDKIENCMLFIFSHRLCPEFRSLFKKKNPATPVVHTQGEQSPIVQLLKRIIEATNDDVPHRDTLIRGYFLAMLSLLFAQMEFADQSPADTITIKRVLDYCAEHYHTDVTLDNLAASLHMNKYYLSHLINDKLHMGFREYINMLRIAEAQHLLSQSDMSITDIALQVGFNSTRTFNRAFTRALQTTPREYRQNEDVQITYTNVHLK